MTDSIPQETTPETPRKRGCLGFLFKSALGCTAFALGVFTVGVLLLPTLLSGTVARKAADVFDTRYRGHLEIASVDLAWFQPQTVQDARILDPGGVEIARASVTLPSLWSLSSAKEGHVGTVVVDVTADLVADDAGVTNLQRALEPRVPGSTDEGDAGKSGSSFDVGEFVKKLDLDLRVNLAHLSWSDAETRRIGTPFEVRTGVVTAVAKPGQPIVVHVGGELAGDSAGLLEVDATIQGPIDPAATWPLGRTQAKGRIERFSTAMVDGLAGLSGDLVEVLGPNFTLRFDATAESAEHAAVDLTLDGARAGLALHARLADGQITAVEKPFLVASTPFPRGIIERIAGAKLPPDAHLALTDVGQPWALRISRLRVPMPKKGATDLASLQPALEAAEIVMDVDLPGSIAFESDALRAANISAGISAIQLTARASPGRPLIAHFEAQLDAGAPGRVRVDATVPDAFAMLAGGPIPAAQVKVDVEGLSTLALGELAGQGDRIAKAIGPVARVELDAQRVDAQKVDAQKPKLQSNDEHFEVRVVLKSDQLDLELPFTFATGVLTSAKAGRISWRPTPEFVAAEIGPRLPEGARFDVEGDLVLESVGVSARILDATTGAVADTPTILASLQAQLAGKLPILQWDSAPGAKGQRARFESRNIELSVSGAGPQSFVLTGDLGGDGAGGAIPQLVVNADTPASLQTLTEGGVPACSVSLGLRGLDTSIVESMTGIEDLIAPLFGSKLELYLDTKIASLKEGTVTARLRGDAGYVNAELRLEGERIVAVGTQDVDAKLRITPEFLTAQLGDSLPPGTRVALAGSEVGELTLKWNEFSTPLESPDLAQRLAATRVNLTLELPAITYADPKTDLVGKPAVLRGTKLTVVMSPETKPQLHFLSTIQDTPPGSIDVMVTALDPLEALSAEGAWKAYRTSSSVRLANVPTALADALGGQDGLLVEALGPRLAVQFDAADLSYERGAFAAKLEGGRNRLALAGRLDGGALIVDKADGLDADLALGPLVMDRVVGRLLPVLRKASFLATVSENELTSSTQFAPFLLNSSNLRFALDGDVSKLNAVLRVDLGQLSFQGLPMLEQLGVSLNAAEVRLPAFTVPIRDGVAYYDKLLIKLGGRDVLFDGSVRLTDGHMSFSTQLPLALVGKDLLGKMGKVLAYIPADTLFPVEVSGTYDKPRLRLKDGFEKTILEKAAGKAVKDGLGEALDGLLGGKKKKKD